MRWPVGCQEYDGPGGVEEDVCETTARVFKFFFRDVTILLGCLLAFVSSPRVLGLTCGRAPGECVGPTEVIAITSPDSDSCQRTRRWGSPRAVSLDDPSRSRGCSASACQFPCVGSWAASRQARGAGSGRRRARSSCVRPWTAYAYRASGMSSVNR